MSKISLQSGVGGRLLSPSIAFTPMVSRTGESKESKDAEKKEQAESWGNGKRPARNEGVGEETRNHPPHRSPQKHPVSSQLAKLSESAASWSSPSTREVRSPDAEAHGKDSTLVVPDGVIASSLGTGQPIAQDHINGEEQDSAEPGWMLPVDDEGKMLYSIDSVNRSVSEGGAKGLKVLHALAEQPGMYPHRRGIIFCSTLNVCFQSICDVSKPAFICRFVLARTHPLPSFCPATLCSCAWLKMTRSHICRCPGRALAGHEQVRGTAHRQ